MVIDMSEEKERPLWQYMVGIGVMCLALMGLGFALGYAYAHATSCWGVNFW